MNAKVSELSEKDDILVSMLDDLVLQAMRERYVMMGDRRANRDTSKEEDRVKRTLRIWSDSDVPIEHVLAFPQNSSA
jgi:hypothetical protein